MIDWIKTFFVNVFGDFWKYLSELGLKLLMGPMAFFLFGPLFKMSGRIAEYMLDQIKPYLGDVGLTTEGLAAWFVQCMRLHECATSLMTFLIMGFVVSIIKKVF